MATHSWRTNSTRSSIGNSGPLPAFSATPATIGHGVAVPESTWKIIVVLDAGQGLEAVTAGTRVIAVDMPNVKGILHEPWGRYRVSVHEIEQKSGYTFLTDVPASIAGAIKARVDAGPTDG